MKKYGVVMISHEQNIVTIIEHNVSRDKAHDAANKFRNIYRITAVTFQHVGLHEEEEAEHCHDCKNLLTEKIHQAAG